jgi:biotin operon repressor
MNAGSFQTGDTPECETQFIGVRKKRWMVYFDKTILDLDLSIYEKMVYVALCAHAQKDGVAFPSVNTIAKEASCSRAKVFEALKTLEGQGIIVRDRRIYEKRGQTSNQYEIVDIIPRPQSGPGGGRDSIPLSTAQTGESMPETPGSTMWTGESTTQTGGVHHVDAVEQDLSNKTKEQKTKEKNTPLTPQGAGEKRLEELEPKTETQKTNAGTQQPAATVQSSGTAERTQPLKGDYNEEIRKAYNTILPELPQAEILTASRAKTLCQRVREDPARAEIDWWRRYFLRVREFPWPMGQNASNWKADFDWLIGEKGIQKILEGGFGRSSAVAAGGRTEAGAALQKKYTDENGVVDARALFQELYGV